MKNFDFLKNALSFKPTAAMKFILNIYVMNLFPTVCISQRGAWDDQETAIYFNPLDCPKRNNSKLWQHTVVLQSGHEWDEGIKGFWRISGLNLSDR